MKKILFSAAVLAAMGIASNANAQLIDESNVTITMDLQPILQLNMNGPQNLNFVFDQIPKYVGGITQYGATQLQVSSTVNWDLYAVGYASNGGTTLQGAGAWDNQVMYGANNDPLHATSLLPITLLELRQDKINPATTAANSSLINAYDYSKPLVLGANIGVNSIYDCVGAGTPSPYTRPLAGQKYIVGSVDAATDFWVGGSYLIQDVNNANAVGGLSNFYYSIDYRIKPGLPAIFPNAGDNNGTSQALDTSPLTTGAYAKPGVYTMNVKYVVMEN